MYYIYIINIFNYLYYFHSYLKALLFGNIHVDNLNVRLVHKELYFDKEQQKLVSFIRYILFLNENSVYEGRFPIQDVQLVNKKLLIGMKIIFFFF